MAEARSSTNEGDPPLLSIASPAYNEEDVIAGVIQEWHQVVSAAGIDAEIVVCDDGSTDRTGAILAELQNTIPQLRIVGGAGNQGYGHALAMAIAACRGQYIATIDSDGQFDPTAIPRFLSAIQSQSADGCVGYRIKKQDRLLRVLADRCLNRLVRTMFGTRLHDTNCALKVVRRELLQSLRLESSGFPLPTEICLRLEAGGAHLVESPVEHRERSMGQSKLALWLTAWRMFRFLVYLRLRLRLHRVGILREF